MKTWMKLLAVAAVLGMAVADEVEGHACTFDEPGISKSHAFSLVSDMYKPCFKAVVTTEMITEVKDAKSLGEVKNFFKSFCLHVTEVVTCIAEVKASLEPCENTDISVGFRIWSDLMEHLMPGGCENDGERVSYLVHWLAEFMKGKRGTLVPLRQCHAKVVSYLQVALTAKIDVASESYLIFKEAPKFRKCLQYVEDEAYKSALEWFINEALQDMKCLDAEQNKLVPCGDIDVSKVTVSDICTLKPLNEPHLYDTLESMAIACNIPAVSHDLREGQNYTDSEWLKTYYKEVCNDVRNLPRCLLEKSAFAEACLTPEEDKQFQLFVQSVKDVVERSCVEDGVRMANVMHEVYSQTAEHGHALRDCHKTVKEARNSHEGHAVSSKNMRFYHDMTSFKQCVVDKLHENNDVSKGVESMINDVLKKMKCVNPEDGTVVLCETIHEH